MMRTLKTLISYLNIGQAAAGALSAAAFFPRRSISPDSFYKIIGHKKHFEKHRYLTSAQSKTMLFLYYC